MFTLQNRYLASVGKDAIWLVSNGEWHIFDEVPETGDLK